MAYHPFSIASGSLLGAMDCLVLTADYMGILSCAFKYRFSVFSGHPTRAQRQSYQENSVRTAGGVSYLDSDCCCYGSPRQTSSASRVLSMHALRIYAHRFTKAQPLPGMRDRA